MAILSSARINSRATEKINRNLFRYHSLTFEIPHPDVRRPADGMTEIAFVQAKIRVVKAIYLVSCKNSILPAYRYFTNPLERNGYQKIF
jgi:hypothetical protein